MMQVRIIGIDLAKFSFQLHGAEADAFGCVPQEADKAEGPGVSGVATPLSGGNGGVRKRALLGVGRSKSSATR